MMKNTQQAQSNASVCSSSDHSKISVNIDDNQYEYVHKVPSDIDNNRNQITMGAEPILTSPEILSSAASLSILSSSSDENEKQV